jgi:IclR family transcriptional regulator, KDG regulon repressor
LNYKNKSLEKTFEIIEALSETPLTPTELSKQIQINRSTLHRFLQNLEELRYLEKLSDNRMRLTQQFIRLGRLAEKHFDFIPIAKPFMKELADQIKESVLIASFNDFKIAYLDKIESLQTVRIVLEAGAEVPPHTVDDDAGCDAALSISANRMNINDMLISFGQRRGQRGKPR